MPPGRKPYSQRNRSRRGKIRPYRVLRKRLWGQIRGFPAHTEGDDQIADEATHGKGIDPASHATQRVRFVSHAPVV